MVLADCRCFYVWLRIDRGMDWGSGNGCSVESCSQVCKVGWYIYGRLQQLHGKVHGNFDERRLCAGYYLRRRGALLVGHSLTEPMEFLIVEIANWWLSLCS